MKTRQPIYQSGLCYFQASELRVGDKVRAIEDGLFYPITAIEKAALFAPVMRHAVMNITWNGPEIQSFQVYANQYVEVEAPSSR